MVCTEIKKGGTAERNEIYSLLHCCKLTQLRYVNKPWGVAVAGNEEILVSRAMLLIILKERDGDHLQNIIASNEHIKSK